MKVQTNIRAGADFTLTVTDSVKVTGVTAGTITTDLSVKSSLKLP